jgi:hypothetical protein
VVRYTDGTKDSIRIYTCTHTTNILASTAYVYIYCSSPPVAMDNEIAYKVDFLFIGGRHGAIDGSYTSSSMRTSVTAPAT